MQPGRQGGGRKPGLHFLYFATGVHLPRKAEPFLESSPLGFVRHPRDLQGKARSCRRKILGAFVSKKRLTASPRKSIICSRSMCAFLLLPF
jgi:hypothetical protein